MSAKIRFTSASATGLVLAKVGHPQRDEPLETSKEVFNVQEEDREALTALFLKPFKNLAAHRFSHHSSLEQHEMNACAKAIFESGDNLLGKGQEIAQRLYAKSNHPNIKSGDLCISLIEEIDVDGELRKGICILKSESVVPFLSISAKDGDLRLHTEQGINPEKIDKGCLILDHFPDKGYYVLTFDRSGTDSRFWVRDFLGVLPVTDPSFLTKNYTNMAVAFLEKEKKEKKAAAPKEDDLPPWETSGAEKDALEYFEGKENFSLHEFEEEQGHRLDESFQISKKDVSKVKKKLAQSVMKLDTGVEIRLKPSAVAKADRVLEHGFDEAKKMKFIKVYFNEDLGE